MPLPATEAAILRGMSKNKAQRFSSVGEFHRALVEAAATDVWPPTPVSQTLVEPKTESEVPSPALREPTAVLPGKGTTLSKAAGATTTENTTTTRRRRWLMPVVVMVAAVGIAVAVASLRPRDQQMIPRAEPVPFAQQPAPPPAPVPLPDASALGEQAKALAPTTAAPPNPGPIVKPADSPAVEPRAPQPRKPAGKKKLKIRNEEL